MLFLFQNHSLKVFLFSKSTPPGFSFSEINPSRCLFFRNQPLKVSLFHKSTAQGVSFSEINPSRCLFFRNQPLKVSLFQKSITQGVFFSEIIQKLTLLCVYYSVIIHLICLSLYNNLI